MIHKGRGIALELESQQLPLLQAWKSNPHYFCEVCKVWMNDNPQARATHERGIKHTENMARSEAPPIHTPSIQGLKDHLLLFNAYKKSMAWSASDAMLGKR